MQIKLEKIYIAGYKIKYHQDTTMKTPFQTLYSGHDEIKLRKIFQKRKETKLLVKSAGERQSEKRIQHTI